MEYGSKPKWCFWRRFRFSVVSKPRDQTCGTMAGIIAKLFGRSTGYKLQSILFGEKQYLYLIPEYSDRLDHNTHTNQVGSDWIPTPLPYGFSHP